MSALRYEIYHDALGDAVRDWRQRYTRTVEITAATGDPSERDTARPGQRTAEPGIALCLSGGGFRGMLFQVCVILRLAELGYLARLARVSSTSGASLTAALLGKVWSNVIPFSPERFEQHFTRPIMALASSNYDVSRLLSGILGAPPRSSRLTKAFRSVLEDATLAELPDAPQFVFSATSLTTGGLWRFTKRRMGEFTTGHVLEPRVPLAEVVAACASPPPFAPLKLTDDPGEPWERRRAEASGGVSQLGAALRSGGDDPGDRAYE